MSALPPDLPDDYGPQDYAVDRACEMVGVLVCGMILGVVLMAVVVLL